MFRRLAGNIPAGADDLFSQHPSVLTTMLEVAWEFRAHDPSRDLGDPAHRSDIPQLPVYWLDQLRNSAIPPINPPPPIPPAAITGAVFARAFTPPRTVLWEHLIYAYMIENTRIYEIFRRVLYEYLHGEKLGVPTAAALLWLRNTEELFYRDPPPFFITSITSHVRPDMRASRRNAYWRMFGMDLTHGTEDGQPYPYIKADAANNEFVALFEELLREAWIAISNVRNTSGANPTDPGNIVNLVENLQNMLLSRRAFGNLSREEFAFVSMMSWFHLTVEYNSPIVASLRAEATGTEQRLFKVAQRVGLPAHGLSKSFFDLADPISQFLILIEAQGPAIVQDLVALAPPPPAPALNPLQTTVSNIITDWSLATGRNMKASNVVVR